MRVAEGVAYAGGISDTVIIRRTLGESLVQSPMASLPVFSTAAAAQKLAVAATAKEKNQRREVIFDLLTVEDLLHIAGLLLDFASGLVGKTLVSEIWISHRSPGVLLDLSLNLIGGSFDFIASTRFHSMT